MIGTLIGVQCRQINVFKIFHNKNLRNIYQFEHSLIYSLFIGWLIYSLYARYYGNVISKKIRQKPKHALIGHLG